MNTRAFDRITQKVLDPLLGPLGFEFDRGAYIRNLDSKVRHVVMLDLDTKRKRFFVKVGLDSAVLDRPSDGDDVGGAYVTSNLSPGGLGKRQPLPAHDMASATKSLEFTRDALERFGLPWLEQCTSLEQLAAQMGDEYDLLKGQLYLEAGDREAAKKWLAHYRARLDTMQGGPEIGAAIRETETLLSRC